MDYKKMMGWFIVITMVLSVVGFVGTEFFASRAAAASSAEEYNGYQLSNQYGQWSIVVRGQTFTFRHSPRELENMTIPMEIIPWLANGKIYLGYVPNDRFVVDPQIQFIGSTLVQSGIIFQQACTIEEGCPDIPLLDCTVKEGMVLRSGDQTVMTTDNKCLVLQAVDEVDMHKLAELVSYHILGVMR